MSTTTHDPLWGTATDHDPLSTTALLATAELHKYLEHIRLSFQPYDAIFANTIHDEIYHELQALPQTWETPQQGIQKMILAATTSAFDRVARRDLHTLQPAEGLPDPKKRKTPLPKPRKESQDSSSFTGSPPTQEAPPPLLSQNEKSAEPEKVKKAISTSLGAQAATTTMVATTANENTPSESAPLTPKNGNNPNPDHDNLNPDHDHHDHDNLNPDHNHPDHDNLEHDRDESFLRDEEDEDEDPDEESEEEEEDTAHTTPAPTPAPSITYNNYDMTTSFGHPTPPGPAGVQDEYYRMSMAASQENQTISKENQTLMAQQGELFSGLIKGMDKASTRAALPKILYGAKAISSRRAFMTTASRYTYRELTTHLRTTQARARASAAAKKTAALFTRQETKLLSEIRSGAYTGPGSAQSL